MKISELIKDDILKINNISESIDVNGIACDSREVDKGFLFVAIKGQNVDGHDFIPSALNQGAVVIIGEKPKELLGLYTNFSYIQVSNSRRILSEVAANFFGNPAQKMKVIGVTGTDGKTTTCNLIADILLHAGKKVGKLTSVGATINGNVYDTGVHITTPNAITIQRYLFEMLKSTTEYAVIESSSHGLSQDRVSNCDFDVGVLTNITHEHYDYHGNYENYRNVKAILFELLNKSSSKNYQKFAVLNADDDSFEYIKKIVSSNSYSYGILNLNADFLADEIVIQGNRTYFNVTLPNKQKIHIESKLLGVHNIYNSLAAIAVAYSQDVPIDVMRDCFLEPVSVKGRLEEISLGQNFRVFVDYAHTENALKNILNLARNISKNRVILLFGLSGGLRDKTKRPAMGKVAIENSDLVIITAVDWYKSERVESIIDQIAAGCEISGGKLGESYWKILNREEAIDFTIGKAEEGDVVIIAGKGHETSLSIDGIEHPWSEVKITERAIARRIKNEI